MATPEGRAAPTQVDVELGPLAVPKASDVLARELRERILTGKIAEGSALPPERSLVEQTRLSRATVREALRILEVQGFLAIRAGRSGGAFVLRPDGGSVTESVELVIRSQQIRLSELHETRRAIEPYCAGLAAERRSERDLEVLDAANQQLLESGEDLHKFLAANVKWHTGVVAASKNALLLGFMRAISRAVYAATENEQFVDEAVRAVAARAHQRVTEAIRDQDPDAAARRMQRHIHGFSDATAGRERRDRVPTWIEE